MEFNINTNSHIFSFKNVYYDDEAGLIKTLLNHSHKNSIIFDLVEMKTFLDEAINDKYFTPSYKITEVTFELMNTLEFFFIDKSYKINLICLVNKISNIIIHHHNQPILNDIKNKITNKFILLKTTDFKINDNLLIEKVYKNLWFLLNYFSSFKIKKRKAIEDNITFTIHDYLFDNLN